MATSGSLSRGLAVLRRLVGEREGVSLSQIASDLDLPKSATHRILASLADEGLIRRSERTSHYELTLELAAMGLRHLADATINELAKPLLEQVAEESGQLVRLGLVDQQRVVWVAKAQGARTGLRYDPDHGAEIPLGMSASGIAWLSTLPEDTALRLVASQDLAQRHQSGQGAPHSLSEIAERVSHARQRGWSLVRDSFEEGISAMAAPILSEHSEKAASGVVSIAGPSLQLTSSLMEELAPLLLSLARDLALLTPVPVQARMAARGSRRGDQTTSQRGDRSLSSSGEVVH